MRVPPGKTIVFTIVSHPVKEAELRWAANVTFAAGSGPDAVLPVAVEDGLGHPVESGVFEFAGQALKVRDGRASLAYADFVRGKHEPAIWLKRPGREPVPGSLTFA